VGARLGRSWVLALIAAALCAVLEARWAHRITTQPLNAARSWVVALGLLSPVALLLSLTVAALTPFFRFSEPDARGAAAGVASSTSRWRHGAAELPILGFALALLVGLVAHLTLRLLSLDFPPAIFVATLVSLSWLLSRVILGSALRLNRCAGWHCLVSRLPPASAVIAGVLSGAMPIAWGIARGTTNGEGGFWEIFAVLSRQELDLRAPALLACIALSAGVGARIRAVPPSAVVFGSIMAALAFSATTFRLLDDGALSLALERGGALSRASLRLMRAASDRDHDGVSRFFGARDCDDTRDDVYPGARELAGNGVDEDCSGADAPLAVAALEPLSAPARTPARAVLPAPAPWTRAACVRPDLNVILISVDTLRHDLGYMGYPRAISRNLDQLAARSVVFERAYSLASYTGKSIGPLLIGKYPSETQRGWWHFNHFGTDERFVQERLQLAGIRTWSVQGHWYFTPEYGVGRGFDLLDLSATPARRQLEGDQTVYADKLSDAALRQLSNVANTGHRFFMWVHYLDPHAEYIRHPGFDFGSRGRDLYDSEVAFTDQQIGRLLDFVTQSDFGARTAIVVTSDHGEAFGEHGMYRHGSEVWEELVRVPLIVYVPGVPARRQNVRRSGIDLVPTLLDLFGAAAPDAELSGKSLLQDICMPQGYVPEQRPVFIDMSAGPYNEERQALIEQDVKLISSAGRAIGLYDLGRDPGEQHDLLGDALLLQRARERFAAFQSGLRLVPVKPH
jgi:choline-sulfatase